MNDSDLRAAYSDAIGRPAEKVIRLPGGAGNRIYWRLVERDGRSAVVMELPPEPGKKDSGGRDTKVTVGTGGKGPAMEATMAYFCEL